MRSLIRISGGPSGTIEPGDVGTVVRTYRVNPIWSILSRGENAWSYHVRFDCDTTCLDADDGIYMRYDEIEPLD